MLAIRSVSTARLLSDHPPLGSDVIQITLGKYSHNPTAVHMSDRVWGLHLLTEGS